MCFSGGNEISLGVFLSVWLFFNAVGAFLMGQRREDNSGDKIYFLPFAALVSVISSVLFLRYARPVLNLGAGLVPDLNMVVISSVIPLFLPSVISGLSFPYLSSMLNKSKGEQSIAYVYGAESLGLVLGYLSTMGFLAFQFAHLAIIGFSYGISSVYLVISKGRDRQGYFLKISYSVILLLFMILFLSYLDRITLSGSFEKGNAGYRFVASRETNYNRYIIAERNLQYVLFVNNIFSKVIGEEYSSKITSHLIMSLSDSNKQVLVVGEASYSLLKHIREHGGNIDYVEYDSGLYSFFKENSLLQETETEGLHFIYDDGRNYIRRSTVKYDIVFIDLPEPLNLQLNRYYTDEFFSEVRKILKDSGIFLFQLPSVTSAPSGVKREYLISVYNSLKNSFSFAAAIEYEHTIFIASSEPVDLSLEKAVSRYRNGVKEGCDFEPEILSLALQIENNKRIMNILESGGSETNSDVRPGTMLSGLILWEMAVSNTKESAVSLISGYGLWFVLLVISVAIVFTFLYGRRRRYFYPALLMFWQGFISMVLELIIIYKFQIKSGTLYYYIAILFSSFMAGLGAGAFLAGRLKIRHFVILSGNLVIALLLYVKNMPVFLLIPILFVNGLLTGLLFGRLSLYS
ncbi:MAG: hypothetical protein N3B13_03920, partial [Deltaproteobacteria bacterium]|nr:hypothetical protein [Deltaproteobacteria bacterium]